MRLNYPSTLKHLITLCIALLVAFNFIAGQTPKTEPSRIQFVDPFIGTGSHGHTFPGPATPHGQIQLSPDTHLLGWDASSGYHYNDSTLYGFSHNHLSGTGIGDLGDVLMLPFTGTPSPEQLAGVLDHTTEYAATGYYRITVKPWDILAELTATERVAWHRYTYPKSQSAKLKIDLAHILQPNWGHKTLESEIEIVDAYTLKGYRKTSGWAMNDPVWFVATFDHPVIASEVLGSVAEINEKDKHYTGNDLIAVLDFGLLTEPLNIKVSLSYTSAKGALANHNTLSAKQSFNEVRQAAENQWQTELGRIQIKTKDSAVLKNFYTALYHTRLMPFLFSDANGEYRGMDGKTHKGTTKKYSAYSLWDTYRSWLPLMTLIDPQAVRNWSYDLLEQGKQGGLLPKWSLNANYTGTMVGYPATAFLADAMTKNLLDSIPAEFLTLSQKSATWHAEFNQKWANTRAENVMPKSIYYKDSLGFVPADLISESVSYGLEMAFYDWCIGRMAQALNETAIAEEFIQKGKAYQTYFDGELGFMRGKLSDGSWKPGFDPNFSEHLEGDFVEGNSWQWTPFVPHDPEGLSELIGGPTKFGEWLDELFTTNSEVTGENASMDISGLIGQYAHGNEPSHHIPYLYQFSDRPWRTQEVIDQILTEFYLPTPEGIIGNEDCGQMSAWYVLNVLGIYQFAPGNLTYFIGRPLVDEASIHMSNGTFTISVIDNSPKNKYVKAVYLNGEKLDTNAIQYSDITGGNTLNIVMTDSPM